MYGPAMRMKRQKLIAARNLKQCVAETSRGECSHLRHAEGFVPSPGKEICQNFLQISAFLEFLKTMLCARLGSQDSILLRNGARPNGMERLETVAFACLGACPFCNVELSIVFSCDWQSPGFAGMSIFESVYQQETRPEKWNPECPRCRHGDSGFDQTSGIDCA